MIAGCIDHMSGGDCGSCDRRDACSELFANLFGMVPRRPRQRAKGEAGPRDTGRTIFRSILGEVFKAVERNVAKARQPAERKPTARPAAERVRHAPQPASPPPREPGPFQREVEGHLEPRLASGPLGIDSVARALGVSRQTLYRRLKAEGVTFEELLDGLRRRLALRLLREEKLSVKEAAWRLGFSDPAAFSRAFKRWTGKSPGAGRR
jgi:AraC-like DNA-binding protein